MNETLNVTKNGETITLKKGQKVRYFDMANPNLYGYVMEVVSNKWVNSFSIMLIANDEQMCYPCITNLGDRWTVYDELCNPGLFEILEREFKLYKADGICVGA